jgi:hypothetical protein
MWNRKFEMIEYHVSFIYEVRLGILSLSSFSVFFAAIYIMKNQNELQEENPADI